MKTTGRGVAGRRRCGWLLALALPVLGLGELVGFAITSRSAPRFHDYERLREPLRALRREGDFVAVAPAWAEPLVAQVTPMALREAGRSRDEGHASAVEVSLLGKRRSELAGWVVADEREVPPFVVRRLDNPHPAPARFDFLEGLSPERVTVTAGGRPCPFRRGMAPRSGGLGGHPYFGPDRFVCGGHPVFNVSRTVIADERFAPKRCIWAHPPHAGELVVTFDDVPLGQAIRGHAGLSWIIERERRGKPVTLRVMVDGNVVGELLHRDGEGFVPFAFDLGERAGKDGSVSFAVSSSDARDRHFCFEAISR